MTSQAVLQCKAPCDVNLRKGPMPRTLSRPWNERHLVFVKFYGALKLEFRNEKGIGPNACEGAARLPSQISPS